MGKSKDFRSLHGFRLCKGMQRRNALYQPYTHRYQRHSARQVLDLPTGVGLNAELEAGLDAGLETSLEQWLPVSNREYLKGAIPVHRVYPSWPKRSGKYSRCGMIRDR